jgi:hypothetical protein
MRERANPRKQQHNNSNNNNSSNNIIIINNNNNTSPRSFVSYEWRMLAGCSDWPWGDYRHQNEKKKKKGLNDTKIYTMNPSSNLSPTSIVDTFSSLFLIHAKILGQKIVELIAQRNNRSGKHWAYT